MPLADTRVIELANRYYVPLFIDYRVPSQTPEFSRISLDIDRQIIETTKDKEQIQLAVFQPSGKILEAWTHEEKWIPDRVYRRLARLVYQQKLEPGDPLFPPITPESRKANPDDLVLESTSRFLITEEQARILDPLIRAESDRNTWEFPPEDLILHRVKAPSVDWLVLTRPEWTTLVEPPGGGSASRWKVEGEGSLKLLKLLVPPNELHLLNEDRVASYTLTAEKVQEQGDLVTVRLSGHIRKNHPFWAEQDDDEATAGFLGYVEFDRAQKKLVSFRLATLDGAYRSRKSHPSLDIPWGVAVLGHP